MPVRTTRLEPASQSHSIPVVLIKESQSNLPHIALTTEVTNSHLSTFSSATFSKYGKKNLSNGSAVRVSLTTVKIALKNNHYALKI